MSEALMNLIMTALATIITGAITVGMAWLQSKIKSDRIGAAVERVGVAAQTVTRELQQTTVDALREANGGKLTAQQIAKLKRDSLEKIRGIMDQPAVDLIYSVGIDFNELAAALVEKTVNEIKSGALPVAAVGETEIAG